MASLVADFLPIFFLISLGALLGRRGFLDSGTVEGLKRIVASVALPAILFAAFARVSVGGSLGVLAAAVFFSCALLGVAGDLASRVFRLPRPSTVFLFQGFEAGMLGYALFTALFGRASLSAFAAADLGQVVFVFTALMAQLRRSEKQGRPSLRRLLGEMFLSPVIIAIAAGLLSSAVVPGALGLPWGDGGMLHPLIDTVGSLTTPLVCLVVGFSLKDFSFRGAGPAFAAVAARLVSAAAVGAALAFLVVPALGYGPLQSAAVMVLFVLPPPFVIPVFRKAEEDGAYIGAVLSLHTVVSILAAVAVAAVFSALGVA